MVKETTEKVSEEVKLLGWVQTVRDHGKITFIDLRDRSGLIQCVGEDLPKVTAESVVEVIGKIAERPEKLTNENLETGKIEIQIKEFKVLTMSEELPLPLDNEGYEIDESVRMRYRYLDLRRKRMAENIRVKSRVIRFITNWLFEKDFVQIETPILTKTTPEGARDFIVPSRLQPGNFYALPQSPQQYKQLLMVAGFERYFQIARCFRDEDPRADRAYGEFTQLDMEMSFVEQEDILALTEELFTQMVKEIFPQKKITQSPWPRIAHKEALEKYGNDKPDLRKNPKDNNELAFAWIIDFPLFAYNEEEKRWEPEHHPFTGIKKEDIPLLERGDVGKVRSKSYDLVLNGYELGSGSIRIHRSDVQAKIFKLLGVKEQEANDRFGFFLEALKYGTPPHGGCAQGFERLLMAYLGEEYLREVQAFPQSGSGKTSVMDAPSKLDSGLLKELSLTVSA